MVKTDAIEGTIDQLLWFHYDLASDVLYLRLANHRERNALGEETDDGFILLRDEQTDEPIGLTIVNWWKRFGQGGLPDSMSNWNTNSNRGRQSCGTWRNTTWRMLTFALKLRLFTCRGKQFSV